MYPVIATHKIICPTWQPEINTFSCIVNQVACTIGIGTSELSEDLGLDILPHLFDFVQGHLKRKHDFHCPKFLQKLNLSDVEIVQQYAGMNLLFGIHPVSYT